MKSKDSFLNKQAAPECAETVCHNTASAPENQADASNMSLSAMQKVLTHHQRYNQTATRNKFINYWKEQIAYKILLEEVQDE